MSESITVIGNHRRAREYTKEWLTQFGFDTEGKEPMFTIEILTSDNPRIVHNDQHELAGLLCGWFQDFGMYEVVQKEKPLIRSNLTIYATRKLQDIEAVAFAKLLAQAVKKYFE